MTENKIKTTIEEEIKHGRGGWTEIERDPMFISYVRKAKGGEESVAIATQYTATEADAPKIKEGELIALSLYENRYSTNHEKIYQNPDFYHLL